jgi:hypothetical protein
VPDNNCSHCENIAINREFVKTCYKTPQLKPARCDILSELMNGLEYIFKGLSKGMP